MYVGQRGPPFSQFYSLTLLRHPKDPWDKSAEMDSHWAQDRPSRGEGGKGSLCRESAMILQNSAGNLRGCKLRWSQLMS